MKAKKCFLVIVSFLLFLYLVGCYLDGNINKNNSEENTSDDPISPPAGIQAEISGAKIKLNWSDVPQAYSYEIYLGTSSSSLQFFVENPYPSLSYTFNTLSHGSIYYFAIKAKKSTGKTSEYSNIIKKFLPPSQASSIYTIAHDNGAYDGIYPRVEPGLIYWHQLSGATGKTYTITVENNTANVSKYFYTEDGETFNGTIILTKDQNIYVKVVSNTAGKYRIIYSIN
jgi:hypothetical protein